MRTLLLLALSAVLVPDRPNPRPPVDATPTPQHIHGTWRPVTAIVLGMEQKPNANGDNYQVVFEGNRMIGIKDGKQVENDSGTFVIDPTKNPPTIDLNFQKQAGLKLAGIYKIDGDQLTLCLSIGPGARPTQFVSTQENQTILMTMKRYRK